MDFKTFYLRMSVDQREVFAKAVGTTRGTCNQIAYAGKQIELGLADAFVAISKQTLSLDLLPLTERAIHQRRVREGARGGALHMMGQGA